MLGKSLNILTQYLDQGHSYAEIEPNNTHVFSQHTETVLYSIHCHFQELTFIIQPESITFYFSTSSFSSQPGTPFVNCDGNQNLLLGELNNF